MKRIFIVFSTIFTILVAGYAGFWFYKSEQLKKELPNLISRIEQNGDIQSISYEGIKTHGTITTISFKLKNPVITLTDGSTIKSKGGIEISSNVTGSKISATSKDLHFYDSDNNTHFSVLAKDGMKIKISLDPDAIKSTNAINNIATLKKADYIKMINSYELSAGKLAIIKDYGTESSKTIVAADYTQFAINKSKFKEIGDMVDFDFDITSKNKNLTFSNMLVDLENQEIPFLSNEDILDTLAAMGTLNNDSNINIAGNLYVDDPFFSVFTGSNPYANQDKNKGKLAITINSEASNNLGSGKDKLQFSVQWNGMEKIGAKLKLHSTVQYHEKYSELYKKGLEKNFAAQGITVDFAEFPNMTPEFHKLGEMVLDLDIGLTTTITKNHKPIIQVKLNNLSITSKQFAFKTNSETVVVNFGEKIDNSAKVEITQFKKVLFAIIDYSNDANRLTNKYFLPENVEPLPVINENQKQKIYQLFIDVSSTYDDKHDQISLQIENHYDAETNVAEDKIGEQSFEEFMFNLMMILSNPDS